MCDGGEGGGGHGGSGNGEEGGGGDDSGTGGGGEGGVGGIGGGGGGCAASAGEGRSSGEVQPEPTRVDRWLDGRPPEGWGDSNSTGRPSAMRTDTRRTDTAARRACIGWGSCSPAVPCVHARESALARRSRRQVRHLRRSATCGPLARRPGRIACRSRGTWVRGETQRTAPMPTAEGGRRWEGSNGAHIVKPSKKTRSGKRVVRRAADPEHQLRSRDSIDAPLSEAATGAA